MLRAAGTIAAFTACCALAGAARLVAQDARKPEARGGAQPAAEQKADGDKKPIVLPKVADGARAEIGKLAPDFALKDLDGKEHTLAKHLGKIVVLEWFDPLCPHCVQTHAETGALREQPGRLKGQGVVWLAINSTDPALEGGKAETSKVFAGKNKMSVPILLDGDGATGRAYGARTAPHCFVVNERGVLVYGGALDNAPLGKVDGDQKKVNYIDAAIADIKAGRTVAVSDTRPWGCTIQYAKAKSPATGGAAPAKPK